MLKIGEQTINEIGTAITAMMLDRMPQINEAYKNCDKAMNMAIAVSIEPCTEGNRCMIGLNFVASRVKVRAVRLVNEMYEPMFQEQG